MSALFLLLLTIILYGLGKAVIKMTYSAQKDTKIESLETKKIKKLPLVMYLPQLLMLITAFVIGIYLPNGLLNYILLGIMGL